MCLLAAAACLSESKQSANAVALELRVHQFNTVSCEGNFCALTMNQRCYLEIFHNYTLEKYALFDSG